MCVCGVCVCVCFSHASNEPKRHPATGGVCVSYTTSLCGNWISRDEFTSAQMSNHQ